MIDFTEHKDRLLKDVEIDANGCWIKKTTKLKNHYTTFLINGKPYPAHRISYQIFKGEIPEGLVVCHTCDVPACFNPEHLWVGTESENRYDCVKKKRHLSNKEFQLMPQTRLSINVPETYLHFLKFESIMQNITMTKYVLRIIHKEMKERENLKAKEPKKQ